MTSYTKLEIFKIDDKDNNRFEKLPPEMIEHVTNFLNTSSLYTCRRVSHALLDGVSGTFRQKMTELKHLFKDRNEQTEANFHMQLSRFVDNDANFYTVKQLLTHTFTDLTSEMAYLPILKKIYEQYLCDKANSNVALLSENEKRLIKETPLSCKVNQATLLTVSNLRLKL